MHPAQAAEWSHTGSSILALAHPAALLDCSKRRRVCEKGPPAWQASCWRPQAAGGGGAPPLKWTGYHSDRPFVGIIGRRLHAPGRWHAARCRPYPRGTVQHDVGAVRAVQTAEGACGCIGAWGPCSGGTAACPAAGSAIHSQTERRHRRVRAKPGSPLGFGYKSSLRAVGGTVPAAGRAACLSHLPG